MATHLKTWNTYWAYSNTSNAFEMRDFKGQIVVSYDQSVANNTSTVYIDHYIYVVASLYQGFLGSGATSKYRVNKGSYGGTYKSVSYNKNYLITSKGIEKVSLGRTTHTITHNDDGTAQLYINGSVTASVYDNNTVTATTGTKSSSFNVALPTIARTSSITSSTSSSNRIEVGKEVTFTISRKSSSFTHDLKYTVNGTTYTIGTGIGTSTSYTFPTSLISQLTTSGTPNITVTCTTKNGSTTIGSSTTTVYLKIPETYVPTCSLEISDIASIPSSWGLYIRNQSKIQGIVTAGGSGGSTISNYTSTGNGQTFTTSTFTTSELTTSGTNTITTTVKDSRGRTASDSKTIDVVDYWTPTLSNFEVKRCDVNGTLIDEGTYGKVVCKYSIAPVNDLNNKSLQVTYEGTTKTFEISDYSGTFTATDLFSDLATNSNHTFTFKIIDSFYPEGVPYTFTMTPAYTTESKLAGGKGVTLGRVATEEGFNVYMPTTIYDDFYLADKDGNNKINVLNAINEISNGGIEEEKLEENGYVKFKNGLIINWGVSTVTTTASTGNFTGDEVEFAKPFSTVVLYAGAMRYGVNQHTFVPSISTATLNTITASMSCSSSYATDWTIRWFAIGY